MEYVTIKLVSGIKSFVWEDGELIDPISCETWPWAYDQFQALCGPNFTWNAYKFSLKE